MARNGNMGGAFKVTAGNSNHELKIVLTCSKFSKSYSKSSNFLSCILQFSFPKIRQNMSIEQDIFENYQFLESKLKEYGFKKKGKKFLYETHLTNENFKVILTYEKSIIGKIMDLDASDEYTMFRTGNIKGFAAEIRQKFVDILLDVRKNCCKNQYFKAAQARRINDYIFNQYEGVPEFLWERLPNFCAYRLKSNKKWYAILGVIPRNKVDSSAIIAEEVEVLNVKVDSKQIQEILALDGIYPAYHMNKKSWISIILDDTLKDEEIQQRLDFSYKSLIKN